MIYQIKRTTFENNEIYEVWESKSEVNRSRESGRVPVCYTWVWGCKQGIMRCNKGETVEELAYQLPKEVPLT